MENSETPLAATLCNVLEQQELKWIFVGGKGGVGKTTCSCCLAILLAQVRQSVLILSTDPAHNLSDAFRQKFSRTPTLVNSFSNLYAMVCYLMGVEKRAVVQEVDPEPDEDTVGQIFPGMENDGFVNEISNAIPGIDEAMSFAEVMKMVQTMDYDCVVFDTAPTGKWRHTLRLLQLPTTIQKGLDKILSLRQSFGGLVEQFAGLLGGGSSSGPIEQMLDKMNQLREIVQKVNVQFKEPDLTTFVCVCIPEFLSLYETERLIQELSKFEIDVHNIIINQVIFPEEAEGSRLLKARVKLQQKYLEQYEELYADFHVTKLPLMEDEVRGSDQLKEFSQYLRRPYQPRGSDEKTS